MTRRPSASVSNDPGLNNLINTKVKHICIVGKASSYQVEKALGITKSDNLKMIGESIQHINSKGIEAIYDAEHFFDGYKSDPQYFKKVKIIASSGFTNDKCKAMALAKAPIDIIGTGSYLPEKWSETYATADIIKYGKTHRVKVSREYRGLIKIERDLIYA